MANPISPAELKKRMDSDEGAVILDVRPANAYGEWRIQGNKAQSMNIQNSKLKEFGVESFAEIPKDQEIVTVCAKGISAQEAAKMLEEKGYRAAFLEGGMRAWSEFYEPVTVVKNNGLAIYQIMRLAKGCLSYVIASEKEAIVVDAGRHIDRYIEFARRIRVTVKHVLDTHLHADHISGGRELARALSADYWIAPVEAESVSFDYKPLTGGQSFFLGKSTVRIVSLHTPGHTRASMSFLVNEKFLLSGDTLFVSGLGRSDLKGHAKEMAQMMFQTVRTTIAELPTALMVLPGHYSDFREINESGFVGETLAEIRAANPMLEMMDEAKFVEIAVRNAGVTPPNYETIIAINRGQQDATIEQKTELEIGPNRCAVKH